MIFEVVRFVAASLLLVLLPGFVAVQAVFPPGRSGLTRLERGYLTVAAGMLLLILVGVTLGFLPGSGRGRFTTFATGFPNVELALAAVTVLLFYVGLHRGAYPRIAARFPRLRAPDARPDRRMRG